MGGTCSVTITVLLCLFMLICTSQASFESQCVKQGTVVNLHCHNEELWKINGSSIDDTLTFITFNISSETGRRDDMEIVADQDYIEEYEDVSLIRCLKRDYSSLFAILVIAEHLQVFPVLIPVNWTSLLLEWLSPTCCTAFEYVNYSYTVALIASDGLVFTDSVIGNLTPSIDISLRGYECKEVMIEISLPGNCEPEQMAVTLLLDPVYPQPQQLEAVLLNSTSFALIWRHPDTSTFLEIDDYDYFTYLISAVVVDTGATAAQYNVDISSTDTPWEEINLAGSVEACLKINFTVSLVRDCRILHNVTALPLYPHAFPSNPVYVAVLFTGDQMLNKIEVTFMTPLLCPNQWATYTFTFTDHENGDSWSTDSTVLNTKPGRLNETVDILTEVERFRPEKSYNVTVTIATDLGNITSSAIFDTCTPFGKAPRELTLEPLSRNNAVLLWKQLCDVTSALPVTYVITATLVSSGAIIHQSSLTVVGDEPLTLPLHLEDYSCQTVNYTVSYGHTHTESIAYIILANPTSFAKDVSTDAFFDSHGAFKGVDIEFKPPRLCEFQRSSYILSYTDGKETWVHDPVAIRNPSKLIKEAIHTNIVAEYTVIVTVFSDVGNFSSNETIGQNTIQANSTGIDTVQIYVVVGVAVVCLVIGGASCGGTIYCLRQRRRRRMLTLSAKKPRMMVQNPLYEATDDEHYESLPDCKSHPSLSLPPPSTMASTGQPYTNVTPQLPPPRRGSTATRGGAVMGGGEKSPKHTTSEQPPECKSLGGMSQYSGEDCYTIMSPAGTLTILPRITITNTDGVGEPLSCDAKCSDDVFTT